MIRALKEAGSMGGKKGGKSRSKKKLDAAKANLEKARAAKKTV